jgi:hypothetical protein
MTKGLYVKPNASANGGKALTNKDDFEQLSVIIDAEYTALSTLDVTAASTLVANEIMLGDGSRSSKTGSGVTSVSGNLTLADGKVLSTDHVQAAAAADVLTLQATQIDLHDGANSLFEITGSSSVGRLFCPQGNFELGFNTLFRLQDASTNLLVARLDNTEGANMSYNDNLS